MPTLSNLYSVSDFTGGLTDQETGTFTLNASATPDSIDITDDDSILEDNNNDGAGQTVDPTLQVLTNDYDGIPAGTGLYSRVTGEIDVTEPDGTKYTLEMNQIVIGGNVYFNFQHDVPPGSTFVIKSWSPVGNTNYADLAGGDPIEEFEYNQVISDTLANAIIGGGATVNEADLSSMFVNDQDSILEDSVDDGAGQTLDANIQNLSQGFGTHAAGAYVFARGYYDVTNTVTGETGRLYQIRVSDNYTGVGSPAVNGQYYAFSNDFNVGDGSNIIITPSTSFHGIGDVAHVALLVCFASGTLIRTPYGETPVEELSQGDLVLTADNGYQPIRWIGKRRLSYFDLAEQPALQPIRIQAGALGNGTPAQDLLVSPQHRVLVASQIAQRMFGATEVLVAAKHLVPLAGIDVAHDVIEVTYVHILFDRHEVVFSNSALTESLYTGPQALKSVSPESKAEILTIFPELADVDYEPLSCRMLANGRMGRKLAIRHKNNNKPVVQSEQLGGVW